MKTAVVKLIFFVLLLLSGVSMRAQTYITPVKSDLTPPTPQSARPIEYQMPQPSLLTGAVDLSIPIYTIVSGDLTLPISLQYHTSGIKVLDDPCPNGYGWSLMPALRATRTILGRPDEHFPYTSNFFHDPMGMAFQCMVQPHVVSERFCERNDCEHDFIQLALPGHTVTRVLDFSDGTPKFRGGCDTEYKVEADNKLDSIVVTDPHGTRYVFGGPYEDQPTDWPGPGTYRITWSLREIRSQSGDTIRLNWMLRSHSFANPTILGGYSFIDRLNIFEWGNSELDFTSLDSDQYENTIFQTIDNCYWFITLSSISFNGGEISFDYYPLNNPGPMLTAITVKSNAETILSASLDYDSSMSRLMKIQLSNQGTYSMEYKDGSISHPDTNAQDWWGYYNGVYNLCLTPYVRLKRYIWEHQENGEFYSFGYADRSVNAEAMQNNILTKITYPTGGYSRFEYEPHSFDPRREEEGDDDIATNTNPYLDSGGGLRVKLIENCPANDGDEKQTVRYEYSPAVVREVPSIATFIDASPAAMSLANVKWSTGMVGYVRSVNIRPFSDYMRYDWGQTPIWYEQVKAIYDEGCIIYRHKDLIPYNNYIIKSFGKRQHGYIYKLFSQGPQLVAKEIYAGGPDGYRIVEKDSMEYAVVNEPSVLSLHITRAIIHVMDNSSSTPPDFENSNEIYGCLYGVTGVIDRDPYEIMTYGMTPYSERLTRSTHTEYTENGEYSTAREFAYVPHTSLLSSVTTTSSTGERRTTSLTYPATGAPGSDGLMAAAGLNGVPVKETTSYRTARTSTRAEYCRVANGAFRMRRTVTSFGENDRGDSLSSPLCVYMPDGLLAGATDPDGRSTSWIWDHYKLSPMWKVEGVAYDDLAAANNAAAGWKPMNIEKPELTGGLATRYSYRYLVGLRQATAPWGTMMQYSYGTDCRLATVSRNGIHLLQYIYDFGHDKENSIRTRQYLADGRTHETTEYYDGLGRPIRTRDDITGIESLTQRDAMGRVWRQSVPGTDAPDEYAWVLRSYEPSPRALSWSTTKAGELWHTLGKSVRARRLVNTGDGSYLCPRHEVTASGIALRPAYEPGTLLVEETEDEDGHITRSFTDRDGLVVMTAEGRGSDMLATHRVYDDYGRLRYVLPPNMEAGAYAATDAELLEKAFAYDYDGCGRIVSAKTPGCSPSLTRYSRAGRVVAQHPSGMEAGKWLVSFFDRYGRTVLSAVATASEEQLAAYADSLPVAEYMGDNPAYGGYTFDREPGFTAVEPQEAVYYDNYSFISDLNLENEDFLRHDAAAIQPVGLESGRRDWLAGDISAVYYDRDGFVCRRHELLSGDTRSVTYIRDRSGAVLRETEHFVRHDGNTFDRVTANTYDAAGRLTRCDVTENGHTASMEYTYDSRGRRSGEKLSNGVSREFLYDIHGWLSEARTRVPLKIAFRDTLIVRPFRPELYYGAISPINPDSIINIHPVKRATLYTDRLLYADGAAPRYSGCPSARITSLGGRYDYRYDAHDRLSGAAYTPGKNAPDSEDFSTAYSYDAVGNPLSVLRHGVVDIADGSETFGVLDHLTYSYDGNRIVEVENYSEGHQSYGRTGYPNTIGSYTWDSAGRMTSDGARFISKISYDYRNLPKTVKITNGTNETNTYDAAGLLRRVNILQRLGSLRRNTMREYVADRVFYGSSLKSNMLYSYFPGGYFDADGAPHFLHTDYQGSVVMVTDSAGNVEQHTAYYPYGEPHREPTGQPILYAGKERLRSTADYNFDARRFYAPSIVMATPDPSASSFHALSPYVYCGANPISNVDLTGRKFTEASMPFVDKLLYETNHRISNFNNNIRVLLDDFDNLLNSKNTGKRLLSKLDNKAGKINSAIQKRVQYEQVVDEITVLTNSTQLYDMRYDASYNKPADIMSGLGGAINSISVYNPKTNVFEMTVGDHDVGSIAHELKHAYQFETGDMSYSRHKNGGPYYDKSDEIAAFERERLFRGFLPQKLPGRYDILQDGPCGVPFDKRSDERWLQGMADSSKSAFRVNGKTYVSKYLKQSQ